HPWRNRRPPVSVIEHGQDDRRKKCEEDQRHDDLLGPLSLILRPSLHPTLEERSVVDRQVHSEADGRRSKDSKKQPASPVVEGTGRPEDQDDEEEGPEQALNNRLPVERIHIKQADTIVAAIWRTRSRTVTLAVATHLSQSAIGLHLAPV